MMIEAMRRRTNRDAAMPPVELVAEIEAEQEDGAPFSPSVMRALAAARTFERAGADEHRPRVLIDIPGTMPFDAKDDVPAALQRRFPDKLKTPTQAEVAARFLRGVLRARRRVQRRSSSWATNW
ncbi:hypothetical protein [Variovorax paradoxus]|uniref:hypothetical protein n=1 Tax=Variovorax paradoxus TaxID=34073 RepID=UPI0012BD4D1D|nr:hypothetical protein [Variovorax paradoxus]